MESSFEESFSGLFSPFEESDFEGGKSAFFGDTDGERNGWDNFQALPSSPIGGFGGDFDMDLEFFRSDGVNGECKVAGPTLAELNDHRSLSPLINPEMERLHRIATRTEGEYSSSWDCTTTRKPQPFIALELTSEKTERPRTVEMIKETAASNCEYGERIERQEKKLPSKPTWTITQGSSSWGDESEKPAPTERVIILPERKLGLGRDGNNQVPKLISTEMKSRFYSLQGTNHREEAKVKVEKDIEPELVVAEPNSPAVEDESADEEMDSDEDFDAEGHVHGTGLAKNRKGRRGEHDDLSPNPRKLLEISRELDRLNRIIGDLKPIHQLPQNARNKSRKEKNKLASR